MDKFKNFTINGKINVNDPQNILETNKKNLTPDTKKKTLSNQRFTIKVGKDVKTDLDTIKALEKIKYDYETIQLLVNAYKNSLSPEGRTQFNILHDVLSDKY